MYATIITADHLPQAAALARSLVAMGSARGLTVLVVDAQAVEGRLPPAYGDLQIMTLADVRVNPVGERLAIAHADRPRGELRWVLKSVLLQVLIEINGREAACYVDPDLYFVSPAQTLADEVHGAALLLCPHWRTLRPGPSSRELDVTLTHGYFNAGLVGATRAGLPALQWWAQACLFACEKHPARGLYDDQRYLDAVPHLFPSSRVLTHQGCNVAQWNQRACRRVSMPDGSVAINGQWPVVCIHFYRETIACIQDGRDPLLRPYLQSYEAALAQARQDVAAHLKVRPSGPVRATATPVAAPARLAVWRKAARLTGAHLMQWGRRLYHAATPEGCA